MPFWNATTERPFSVSHQWSQDTYYYQVREFATEYQQEIIEWLYKKNNYHYQNSHPEWFRFAKHNHLRAKLDHFISRMRRGRVPEERCMLAIMVITSTKLSDDLQRARKTGKPSELMKYIAATAENVSRLNQTQQFLEFLRKTKEQTNENERFVQKITRFEHMFLLKTFAELQHKQEDKFALYDEIIQLYSTYQQTLNEIAEALMVIDVITARYRTTEFNAEIDKLLQYLIRFLLSNKAQVDPKKMYGQIGWRQVLPVGFEKIGLKKDLVKSTLSSFELKMPEQGYRVEGIPENLVLVFAVELDEEDQMSEEETLFRCQNRWSDIAYLTAFYKGKEFRWYIAPESALALKPAPAPVAPSDSAIFFSTRDFDSSRPLTAPAEAAAVASAAPTPATEQAYGRSVASTGTETAMPARTIGDVVAQVPTPHLSMYQRTREIYIAHQREIRYGVGAAVAAVSAATAAYTMS